MDGAAPLWLHSAPPRVSARDLALCHPRLAPHEVRTAAYPIDHGSYRTTMVSGDRVGFLADSAAVMAEARASIVSASAVTWPNGVEADPPVVRRVERRHHPCRATGIGNQHPGVARAFAEEVA